MNYDSLKLDNQLCHRFYIASNAIVRAYRPILKKLDLTYPQYVILMALWEKDAVTHKELSSQTKVDSGSLTSILQKLLEKKIIKITIDKEDKRVKTILLTAKGLKLKDQCLVVPEQAFCQVDSLSQKEIQDLVRLIDKVNHLLLDDEE